MSRIVNLFAALLLTATASSCALLTPSGADRKPVKVFLLSGQSNMTGRGMLGWSDVPLADQKHTLFHFVHKPGNGEKYAYLRNGTNTTAEGWAIRDDVFITIGDWPHPLDEKTGKQVINRRHGGLSPHYGGRKNGKFGPELAIGHLLGEHYEEPVVLVKVSFGGNSLSKHFRPPSSGGELGDKYPKVVKAMREALAHLPEIVPGYKKRQGYELVGFFWNQGLSDMNTNACLEYEENLANLIKDLRRDLNAPDMKAVIAITGNWGWDMADLKADLASQRERNPKLPEGREKDMIDSLAKVQQAQEAVSRRPEFQGNVATAETRDFWRSRAEFGGHGTETHWCANGESYWLIGESMGLSMIRLIGEQTERKVKE